MTTTPTLAERILAMTLPDPAHCDVDMAVSLGEYKFYTANQLRALLAEAAAMAEQAAVKLPVKTWQERLQDKFPETAEHQLFTVGHLEHAMEAEIADLRAALAAQEPAVTPEMIANVRKIAEDTLATSEAMDKLRSKYGLAEQEGQEAIVNLVDVDEVKQLCRDFSSRIGNVYIGDVEASLDGLVCAHRAAQEGDAKDAERYRFLRHADLDDLHAQYYAGKDVPEGEELDRIIDAAMASTTNQKG